MTEQHTVWASHCPEYSSINSPTTGIYLEQFQSPIVLHCVKTYTVTLRTDSRSELVYREHCLTLTWVLAAAQALCGLGQPEFSLPPQLSRDGTLPPLSPDGSRTHVTLDSKSVPSIYMTSFCAACVCLWTHRQLSRLAERPPASRSLLLEDGDSIQPFRQHVRLTRLCRFCPPRETVEV